MTRRQRGSAIFNAGTVVNVLGIPVLTGAIVVGGFYFTTNAELAEHTRQIQEETRARAVTERENLTQREKLRDALVQSSQETQKAISQLAQTAAAQSEQIKGIDATLDRVVSGLQTLSAGRR